MRVAVLGAGAWGTALAVAAAQRHEVLLWARDAAQAEAMRTARRNTRYLPEAAWPEALQVTADHAAAVAHGRGGLIIIGTPMSALRGTLAQLDAGCRVLWLCKGFEASSGMLGHQIAEQVQPGMAAGVLSGPSFAQEVAQGLPTALVAASPDQGLADAAVEAFHHGSLRVYTSPDPVGVEVGGAVKNVLAIATGIADGLGLGLNARAALITRGLAEMTRLGVALGAQPATFMGLAGLGDLVLTATGDLSRNRRVGLLLAQGRSLADTLATLGHVAEGVYSAATVVATAQRLKVEMPLTFAVQDVLTGRLSPRAAVGQLMQREARSEGV
ncbi:NAD(P)H-dependent glycerol-3-phosphate dehydrogenase [Ideonella sp.]|jgi:glycerol-3-phosphate dehydrogenase (NAD(P)+)|uniref:NAD(P)H-dependent glycerol-3-phosphate dehydrogenase n=1 Tax=Ideonella sp. TaxID=1929293 RepID=UPI0037C02E2E